MRAPQVVRRVANSMWTLRVCIVVSIAVQIVTLLTNPRLVWQVIAVLFIALLIGAWARSERSHHAAARARWNAAAAAADPVLYLARSEYQRDLSLREHMALADWHVAHGMRNQWRPPTSEEIAAAPRVVRDYYAIGANPPREGT